MNKKERIKILIIIFAIALIVRLALFFYLYTVNGPDSFNPFLQGTDQAEYGRLAVNLSENSTFSLDKNEPFSPDPSRTPIFPLFLTIGYLIGGSFFIPTLLNILISVLTAIIVFEIALLISGSKKISISTAIIFSLLPYGVYLSNLIMADTLFVFLFSLFVFFFLKIIKQKSIQFKIIILGAVFLGLATLVRPITQFFVLIPAVLLLFLPSIDFKKKISASLMFLMIFVIVLSPWLTRNYLHFNEFFLSSIGRYHLYASYFTPWKAYREGISRDEAHARMLVYIKAKYGLSSLHGVETSTALANEAKKEILTHPLSYGFFHLSTVPIYFFNNDFLLVLREAFKVELPNVYIAQKIFTGDFGGLADSIFGLNLFFILLFLVSYLFVALKFVFGVLGGVFYLWRDKLVAFFSLTTILYFPLIIGSEGHARFRLPVEVFLIIFSLILISQLYNRFKKC